MTESVLASPRTNSYINLMKTPLIKKNNPTVIILYGAMAVGKLTVGKELAKQLKYKLTHNHLINDLVSSVFDRDTFELNSLVEKLRYEFYESAVKYGHNIIITHCYSHSYVSPTGLSDPDYMKNLENKLVKSGAKVLFVHLQADAESLLTRVKNASRREHKKLTNVSVMKVLINEKDFKTSAPVKNNLVIDNTKLSPKKVVQIIVDHLKRI